MEDTFLSLPNMIEKAVQLGFRVLQAEAPEMVAALEVAGERLLQASGIGTIATRVASAVDVSLATAPERAVGSAFRSTVLDHESSHLLPTVDLAAAAGDLQRVAPAISDEAILEGISRPQSMTPKAYKLLNPNGSSPGAPEVRWSLPRRSSDGTWVPGHWQEPIHSNSPLMTLTQGRSGLFVTDDPMQWQMLGIASGSKLSVFEAQIGDVASVRAWTSSPSYDFAAQRVRLLRQLTDEEVKTESKLRGHR
jgi:hypothetical protein